MPEITRNSRQKLSILCRPREFTYIFYNQKVQFKIPYHTFRFFGRLSLLSAIVPISKLLASVFQIVNLSSPPPPQISSLFLSVFHISMLFVSTLLTCFVSTTSGPLLDDDWETSSTFRAVTFGRYLDASEVSCDCCFETTDWEIQSNDMQFFYTYYKGKMLWHLLL